MNRPLRVAIVGAGPAGFYTAAALLRHPTHTVQVDLFDRLPAPYGLVRAGVAPDHQKIKNVVRAYRRTAGADAFRFFGNVALGRDLTVEDLDRHYDQWVLAVGCGDDRRLGIDGEDLPGVHSAREFVAWYNGHPDHVEARFDLSGERAVIVGVGNVAVDVARILTRDPEELADTDIASHALAALRRSRIRQVTLVGRRGPCQAAFTPQELKELGNLDGVDVIVRPDQLDGPIPDDLDRQAERNLGLLRALADRGPTGAPRRIVLEFFAAPRAFLGTDRLTGVRVERTRLERDGGAWRPVPTGAFFDLPAEVAFRSIGYRGHPIPGLPFDARRGILPNRGGRLTDGPDGPVIPRRYVAGWAKRGPTGVIGTNRADAADTVAKMIADAGDGFPEEAPERHPDAIPALLRSRGITPITWDDWERIDALERARGAELGKIREKFVRVEDVLQALRDAET